MKRLFIVFISLALLCALCSCAAYKDPGEYLEYQNGGEYTGVMKIKNNGAEYDVTVGIYGETDEKKLTFSSPSEMTGYTYIKDENGIRLVFGENEITVGEDSSAAYLFALFELDADSVSSVNGSGRGKNAVCTLCFDDGSIVTVGASDNRPLYMENGYIEFELDRPQLLTRQAI